MKPHLNYEQFQLEKEIPNLDGLRAISILLVILHHVGPIASFPFLENIRLNGNVGVIFFFIISGFLITSLALRELDFTGKFSWKNFYIRRSLRIFPLYYAFFAVVSFLIFVVNIYPPDKRQDFLERLPSFLFYYSNLTTPAKGAFAILWSLAVEEQFYLFFSIVFFLLPKKWSALLFIFLAMIYFVPFQISPSSQVLNVFKTLIMFQGPIYLGAILAYLFNNKKCYNFIAPILVNPWVLIISSIVAIICLGTGFSTVANPFTALNLAIIVGSTSLMPSIQILGGTIMSYIGKISYGIYLFHIMVLWGIQRFVSSNQLVLFILGSLITIGIASLSYTYFESPFLKLKKRLSK